MKKHIVIFVILLFSSFSAFSEVESTYVHEYDGYVEKAQAFYATGEVDSILHWYRIAQKVATTHNLVEQSTTCYHEVAKLFLMMNMMDSALTYFSRAVSAAQKGDYWLGMNKALGQMANVSCSIGKNLEGNQYAKQAIEAGKKANYPRGIGVGYLQAGNSYQYLGRTEEALQCYLEASNYFSESNFQSGVASCWTNMASIYYTLENYDMALEYYKKSVEIQAQLDNKVEVGSAMLNMAIIYTGYNRQDVDTKYKNLDSAFCYYKSAIRIFENLQDSLNIVRSKCDIGLAYMMIEKWTKAKEYLDESYRIALAKNYNSDIIAIENGYALLYQKQGNFEKSKEFFLKEFPRILEGNYKEKEFMWYRDMAKTLDSLGEYRNALRYYERYVSLHDTLRRHDVERQMNQLSVRYSSEMKDQEIEAAKERQKFMEEKQDQLQARNRIMTGAAVTIAVFLMFALYMFYQVRKANSKLEEQNEQINKQNAEIEKQKNEVTAQKEQIEVQQQNILDSIHYASRIQSAILPQRETIVDLFGEHNFVLFKPRDIVSGDFYWIGSKNEWKVVVAADCTGHGVPGAFMSMLGCTFLNEIINDQTKEDLHANEILNSLRDNIIHSLRQTGKVGEQKDGMDMALWMFNESTRELRFAGANNPLVVVRKNASPTEFENNKMKLQSFVSETTNEKFQIIQVAGDKMPIGIYAELNPFEEVSLQLEKGDSLYTFSDGYQDQFGGEKGKKFMIKRLKQLFVNIYDLPMEEQKVKLDEALVNWIKLGNTEQIDDVLVIGYRV